MKCARAERRASVGLALKGRSFIDLRSWRSTMVCAPRMAKTLSGGTLITSERGFT